MTFEVIFHGLAAKEYLAASRWYAARSTDAAVAFHAAVELALERIANNAEALPGLFGKYRYVRVRRFPYVLVFRPLSAEEMQVMAIAHASRRSGYWRRRK
jgi:plasmid stabilization system protein ParE